MRNKVLQGVLDETPKDIDIFIRLYSDLVVRINQIMKDKSITQADLARSLEKRPSEIHKWLNGNHNLTLQSIAKLEAELGEPLFEIASDSPKKSVQDGYFCTEYKLFVYTKIEKKENIDNLKWLPISQKGQKNVANVG